MTKRLHVRPDDDVNTITISNACNIYGLPRYRVYRDDREYFIANFSPSNLFYIINIKDNNVHDIIKFSSIRDLFKYLLRRDYQIDVVYDEE